MYIYTYSYAYIYIYMYTVYVCIYIYYRDSYIYIFIVQAGYTPLPTYDILTLWDSASEPSPGRLPLQRSGPEDHQRSSVTQPPWIFTGDLSTKIVGNTLYIYVYYS